MPEEWKAVSRIPSAARRSIPGVLKYGLPKQLTPAYPISSTMMITKLGRSSAFASDAERSSNKQSSRFISYPSLGACGWRGLKAFSQLFFELRDQVLARRFMGDVRVLLRVDRVVVQFPAVDLCRVLLVEPENEAVTIIA